MSNNDQQLRAKQLVDELTEILKQLSDIEAGEFFCSGALDDLLGAILEPSDVEKYANVAEFFLANKMRATYIAILRHAITHNYSFKRVRGDEAFFASPSPFQWFEDGVMLLDAGIEPFTGILALYQNGNLTYPIAARDAQPGEQLGPEDFNFIDIEGFKKLLQNQVLPTTVDEPLQKLRTLLDTQNNTESHYQELLQDYSWIFGLQYSKIQRHTKLDDKNIPDFTGVRVHDGCRDIFEIKPPFVKIFRQDGSFTAEFSTYLDQAERYLDFVIRNQDYLSHEKGLLFENPKCYLIVGFDLSQTEIKGLRRKERMGSIQLLTYNDLWAFVSNTVYFAQSMIKRGEND